MLYDDGKFHSETESIRSAWKSTPAEGAAFRPQMKKERPFK